MNAPGIIEVRDVSREFRSAKKEEGLKGAFKLLTRPQYQTHTALKKVSFSIEPGSFNGLIGANGAGKTTLLKILAGLIPPSTGTATVLGFEPFKRSIDFRRQIALVMGQKAQLWWDLPAVDAFDLLRAIYEIPEKDYRERLNTLAELLDVKRHLNTQIRRLSLGERMKMEIIGAIIHWPRVIFLDEPTIGLDVLAAHKLREFLRVFNQKEKATIILTSHNMDDIEKLCSRVLILRSGDMIYDGTPNGLTRAGEQRVRMRFLELPSMSNLVQLSGLKETAIQLAEEEEDEGEEASAEATSKTVYFTTGKDQIVGLIQKMLSKHTIIDMGIEEQSLENVIQRLYEEERTIATPATT